jgi:hypothetical protein
MSRKEEDDEIYRSAYREGAKDALEEVRRRVVSREAKHKAKGGIVGFASDDLMIVMFVQDEIDHGEWPKETP